jgi:hypothetical protein
MGGCEDTCPVCNATLIVVSKFALDRVAETQIKQAMLNGSVMAETFQVPSNLETDGSSIADTAAVITTGTTSQAPGVDGAENVGMAKPTSRALYPNNPSRLC